MDQTEQGLKNFFWGQCVKGRITAQLFKGQTRSFEQFCIDNLSRPIAGEKYNYYVTIGNQYEVTPANPQASGYHQQPHFHRNKKSQLSAWLVPLDGDTSKSGTGCIPPDMVHATLNRLHLNHVIYTTYNHMEGINNRWRLFVPCVTRTPTQLDNTVQKLFNLLQTNGCHDLVLANESRNWANPWFLPTRNNPDDGHFKCFGLFSAQDFEASVSVNTLAPPESPSMMGNTNQDSTCTLDEQLTIIQQGLTPLHETLRNYIWGELKDGRTPSSVKSLLHALTRYYNLNDGRLKSRKEDINRMTDITHQKLVEDQSRSTWVDLMPETEEVFTEYPDQGGNFETIVQYCMRWQHFPNRQIAVVAAHALISTLGGRTYTLPTRSGIVYTCLITGRSTIGKAAIKDFIIHILNNFAGLNKVASLFLGSHYYTSAANMVKEMEKIGSILSIRTDSAQSDQSTAGDMPRVTLYELEFATKSGIGGFISSGGQNDKVPHLYSPAVTVVRESNALMQKLVDMDKHSIVSGITGRRSHVVIDPTKPYINKNREHSIPYNIKNLVNTLFALSKISQRRIIDKPLAKELWIFLQYQDPFYLEQKQKMWVDWENQAVRQKNMFYATFFGRLHEKVPAFAARLAIADNAITPIITNIQIDIAEKSLLAEVYSHHQQNLKLNPWDTLISHIVDIFRGDMTEKKTLYGGGTDLMLRDGACVYADIIKLVRYKESYQQLASKDNFENILSKKLEFAGIRKLSLSDTKRLYNKRSTIYKRA